MNTNKKPRYSVIYGVLSLFVYTTAFSQSVTILPRSQQTSDTLSTRFFRMTNGAGMFKFMVSDNIGNGMWIESGLFTDAYWTMNNAAHLYQVPSVNLGVGTSTPGYKLDVRQSNANIIASFSGNNANGVGIRISSGATGTDNGLPVSGEWQLYQSGNGITSANGGYGQLHFKDQAGTKMILRNNGRLGIGVLNPAEMLEVNGNIRVNGKIDIRNTGLTVAIGEAAGAKDDLSFNSNTFIGFNSGANTTTGSENAAIGSGTLALNITGNSNFAAGHAALFSNKEGSSNVAIGAGAGFSSTGSSNIFLGNNAGYEEKGDNKLYIHNSGSTTPLVFGDFSERNLAVNGRLIIGAHKPFENSCKLEVIGNADASFIVQSWTPLNNTIVVSRLLSPTGLGPQMRFQGVGASFIDIGQDSKGSFVIEGGDTPRLVVENTGKIGIGTSTPQESLSVVGGVNIDHGSSNTGSLVNGLTFGNGSGEGIASDRGLVGANKWGLDLYTNNTIRMSVSNNGNVGIGTNVPVKAKLQISGSSSTNFPNFGYLNSSGSTGTANGSNNYSIYASDRIAASEFNAFSDARIKEIKGISNSETDLNALAGIQITDYTFKDKAGRGNAQYKKVIAQQVEGVYPIAVSKITDFIPDIYQFSTINKGLIPLTGTTLKKGDLIKLIDEQKQDVVEVLSVSDNGIQVNSERSGKVFVYGREVNDFRTVDYEALTTLNISATQQLLKRIEALEKENLRFTQLAKEVDALKSLVLSNQSGK